MFELPAFVIGPAISYSNPKPQPPSTNVRIVDHDTWYLFAPTGRERRNSALELQVRSTLEQDLRIEDDLAGWFPLDDAPGL